METIRKLNFLIGLYFSILLVLLLCVSTTPLLIRHGITLTRRFVIEEDVLEVAMIVALFGFSFLVLILLMNRLRAYQLAVDTAVHEKYRLISRLADAYRYIGKVNVEIQEIESALGGAAFCPQSKKEFRQLVDQLVTRAMALAATPWLVVRMIDPHSGQTIKEHAVRHPGSSLPSITLGNRALLEGTRVDGIQTIGPRQPNLDLLTVFILPAATITKEKSVLLTVILNHIEMLFILYRAGCIKPMQGAKISPKEIIHDSHH